MISNIIHIYSIYIYIYIVSLRQSRLFYLTAHLLYQQIWGIIMKDGSPINELTKPKQHTNKQSYKDIQHKT